MLETGGPVAMPWLERTAAVIEAWYPGQRGGEAIADILSGAFNPSGRLPVTFPASLAQLPHPTLPGDPRARSARRTARSARRFVAEYREGAQVGYKWFAAKGERPLFPFGFGLSYTRFALDDLSVKVDGKTVQAAGDGEERRRSRRRGDAAVLCRLPGGAGAAPRLVGWRRVELQPGEARTVSVDLDSRLIGFVRRSGAPLARRRRALRPQRRLRRRAPRPFDRVRAPRIRHTAVSATDAFRALGVRLELLGSLRPL